MMDPEQFCVRWNSYQSNLQNSFPKLLTCEHFVDVTLACEGESIKCHKVVLSACSAYFEKLLVQNPCQHPIIFMKDMRYWEIQALVDFMYKGEVNVNQDKLSFLLKAAEALQIKGLCGPDQESTTQTATSSSAPMSLPFDTTVSDGRDTPPYKRRRSRPVIEEKDIIVPPPKPSALKDLNLRRASDTGPPVLAAVHTPPPPVPTVPISLPVEPEPEPIQNVILPIDKKVKEEVINLDEDLSEDMDPEKMEDYGGIMQDDSNSMLQDDFLPPSPLDQPGTSGLSAQSAMDKTVSAHAELRDDQQGDGMYLYMKQESANLIPQSVTTPAQNQATTERRAYMRHDKKVLQEAAEQVLSGISAATVATRFNIPRTTLQCYIYRHGIKLRQRIRYSYPS